VRYFSLELKDRAINLTTNYNSDIPDIWANERELEEVISNLISNAVKSIQKNKRRGNIKVSTDTVEISRILCMQISIEDDGIGIRNEDREKIFQRGFTTYPGGTGMGLFITKEILEGYGGSIDFDSRVGKGTKFVVNIPIKRHQVGD
jgi:signal transduction histidine kinase